MTACQSTATAGPFQDTMQVCTSFLEAIGTPRALSVSLLASSYLETDPQAFADAIKTLHMRPEDYLDYDVNKFADDYQATVLFSKIPSPFENPALQAAAIDGFKEGEKHCASLNDLWFQESRIEALLFKEGVDIQELRSIIRHILGRAPKWNALLRKGRWSTGSSYLLSRYKSNEAAKCEYGVSVTLPLAKAISKHILPEEMTLINWSSRLVLAPGNLVDTVPKNITTDRTIAKEPEINMFFQNAIGLTIRERLKAVGIDLNDQSNNQWACMQAKRLGLATLDLKNASNSICLGLVCALLPPDWLELILTTRSERGTFSSRQDAKDGVAEWFEYSMISSMGNGFTFELESLLFFAICLSAGVKDYNCYVYGDDIVIPQRDVSRVLPVLELCGFSLNAEKSFLEGTFFESCGTYAFNGIDITPLKIKELLYGPKDCIVLANKIRWFSHLRNHFTNCDRRFLPSWQACIRRLPTDIRQLARGPAGYGLGLWMNFDEVLPKLNGVKNRKKPDYQQFKLHELRVQNDYRHVFHYGIFVAALSRVRALDYYESDYWNRVYKASGNRIRKESEGYSPGAIIHNRVRALDYYKPDYWDQEYKASGNRIRKESNGYSLGKIFHNGSSWYDLGYWT